MIVGIPTEVKDRESRVSTTPAGVSEFVAHGHRVLVESCAGEGSGFRDEPTRRPARNLPVPRGVFEQADMIVKVKEPVPAEYNLLRENQLLFTYLHLAANEQLTRALMDRKVAGGRLRDRPACQWLAAAADTDERSRRADVRAGRRALSASGTRAGYGVLLGGVPGVEPAQRRRHRRRRRRHQCRADCARHGRERHNRRSQVDRLRHLDLELHGRLLHPGFEPDRPLPKRLRDADLVIGGVLLPGRAPEIGHDRDDRIMRTGSVVVDVAIDQGGCIETRETDDSQQADL